MKPFAMLEASLADHRLSRRRFLKWGALAAGMSFVPRSAVEGRSIFKRPVTPPKSKTIFKRPITPPKSRTIFQPPITSPDKPISPYTAQGRSFFQPVITPPEKAVALYNTHTGESLNAVYWIKGQYLPDALSAVDRVLRDHRTDEVKPIDPQLLDLLHAISEELGCSHPFSIISAYRSPATNAYLRFMSRGVAEHSLHMDGKAVDVRLPGWGSYMVRRVAVELRMGGVGYYPRSDFVHIDVGPIRYW
jgi:uncharacterized protein YcbK (DUF882 family)